MKTRYAVIAISAAVLSLALGGVVHTATREGSVEARLQKLEDTEAIRMLLVKYGRALDARDFRAYGDLFAKDGTWKGGMGSATSPRNIEKMVADGFAKMSPKLYENSNHVMTSFDIQVDGDTAKAWSRWLWVVEGSNGKPQVERGGIYQDTLVRENGQWKFKQRQAITEINK
jgi:uncharacterized protein (TIGR02246 family)